MEEHNMIADLEKTLPRNLPDEQYGGSMGRRVSKRI
jgi:hypothetical protein